jgi:hypothetical protein
MKKYQSVLPMATRRTVVNPQDLQQAIVEASAATEYEQAQTLKEKIESILLTGFWFCRSHEGICDRIESEHGQPAWCSVCGSCRIEWHPPIDQAVENPQPKVRII